MGAEFDAVVIGRNEGARLAAALGAVIGVARHVVYVDSGSRDDSVAQARALGVQVHELDPTRPFSAARARNEGFAALGPGRAELVQFVDGDCVLQPNWPATALDFMASHPRAGLVFGRQFEAAPDASVYNALIDWEWDKPTGPDSFCAGCLLMRSAALEAVGGYDEALIAGEDDDLCLRMQQAGWQTWRITTLMSEHDAALLSFAPWWRRTMRAGHSYGALGRKHGTEARAQRLRALGWGVLIPGLALIGLLFYWPVLAVAALLVCVSLARQSLRFHRRGNSMARALHMAAILMAGKMAEAQGLALYVWRRLRGQGARLIEYK